MAANPSPPVHDRVEQLVESLRTDLGTDRLSARPPAGYPGEVEAAIIDSICSVRARYGSETTGVRRHVAAWRAHRGGGPLDDMNALVDFSDWNDRRTDRPLRQKIAGTPKAQLVSHVAEALLAQPSIKSARDLLERQEEAEARWMCVRGLGWTTWQYVRLLLLEPTVKPDTLVTRYVAHALSADVTPREVVELVCDAAETLEVDPRSLDHAIWKWERRRRARKE